MKNEIKAGDKVRVNGAEGVVTWVAANNGDCVVRFSWRDPVTGITQGVTTCHAAHEVKLV